MINIKTLLTPKTINNLKAGDLVYISGVIYTARDRAHQALSELIYKGKKLPFEVKGSVIYYCGPTPAKKGQVIGSCGPTTSSRMDSYAPLLYKLGLAATVGKGERDEKVIAAIKKYRGVYFITWGGCGAYLNSFVKSSKIIAFKEFGAEAIRKLEVENLPAVVAVDSRGRTLQGTGCRV
ncbi:MAG: FumA C-terminus/TtdB family hydratase beta subunit [Candidatus Omnitrophica bacterium]|nr:FumA C-terminus/TtdB family hydratase beta subunit [Candidatus Omnitrophota bacterium]